MRLTHFKFPSCASNFTVDILEDRSDTRRYCSRLRWWVLRTYWSPFRLPRKRRSSVDLAPYSEHWNCLRLIGGLAVRRLVQSCARFVESWEQKVRQLADNHELHACNNIIWEFEHFLQKRLIVWIQTPRKNNKQIASNDQWDLKCNSENKTKKRVNLSRTKKGDHVENTVCATLPLFLLRYLLDELQCYWRNLKASWETFKTNGLGAKKRLPSTRFSNRGLTFFQGCKRVNPVCWTITLKKASVLFRSRTWFGARSFTLFSFGVVWL